MKQTIIALAFAFFMSFSTHAQVPSNITNWSIKIRMYRTTAMPGTDDMNMVIYKSGSVPARLVITRSAPGEERTVFKKKLGDEEAKRIYELTRNVINNHTIEDQPWLVKDGSSLEVELSANSRRISVTYDSNSFCEVETLEKLFAFLNQQYPKDFATHVERNGMHNQKLQPTVKTPVESGKVQGTAAEL
ncbi:hypothetical protein P4C99_21020 [Pontiellaceae bacterium B1224]|nr:hypothetical protein [Pontiellaceae bacterium B1224]